MKVLLQLSDPWSMGEALGWPKICGTVAHRGSESWLVEIDQPFVYEDTEYRFVVISPRHVGEQLIGADVATVSCAMIRTTREFAESASPCDVTWWRGGHSMIGSVVAVGA